MSEPTSTPECLACGQDSDAIPLIPLDYRGERIWICPQHLPLLIHDPKKLAGKLAGAEDLGAAGPHHRGGDVRR